MTYRENARIDDAPRGWVALVWRWLMLRRQDRFDREAKALPPKRTGVKAVQMTRATIFVPYRPVTVILPACPGKNTPRPRDVNHPSVQDYWLCTPGHCCCEVIE